MRSGDRIVGALALAGLLLSAPGGWARTPELPRVTSSVLVLASERSDVPGVAEFERGLREGLASPSGVVDVYVEYLDIGRFPGAAQERELQRHLAARYAGRRIDAVVAFVDSAFQFALDHREALFPAAPLIGAAVERRSVQGRPLPPGVTSVPAMFDYAGTLRLALALQPGLQEVVAVHGLAEFDRQRRDDARRALEAFQPAVKYRMLSGIPLAQMEAEVRRLPPESMVLVLSMVQDAEGRALAGADYAARLSEASSVPVYSTFPSHIRRGALGGAVVDWIAIGRATASVTLQLLDGKAPAHPIAVDAIEVPVTVNWRALRKWQIPPERVPAGAQTLFREPGLLDTHRSLVVAACLTLAVLAALVAGLAQQLGQRQRAEAELRESELRARMMVQQLPIAILMLGQDGRIELANAQAERLLGYGAQELEGRAVEMLVPERYRGDHASHRAGFFDAPATRPMAANRDLTARRKDGSEVRVEIGLTPFRSRGELLVLAAIVDLSARQELQRKQQELEHVSRYSSMGEIAASLAHELSQPLAAILSNAQAGLRFLEQGQLDKTEIRAILQDVVADDRRAGNVVSALRAMLRREQSDHELFDLAQVADNVLKLLNGELVGQQVSVETALAPDCRVLGNRTQIEQVLLNLVMNSVDAMRSLPAAERRLRIEVAHGRDGEASVAVRDSGVGIAPEQAGKVFDAFWTTKPTGMGMGLAICSSIVKSHGGEIRVAPAAGRGATLAFTLPLARPG
jgi:PAS domain S-box-containing protein